MTTEPTDKPSKYAGLSTLGEEIVVRYTDGTMGTFRMPTLEELEEQDRLVDEMIAKFFPELREDDDDDDIVM